MVNQCAVKPRVFARRRSVTNVTSGIRQAVIFAWFCFVAVFQLQTAGQQVGQTDAATPWLTGKELDQSSRLEVSGEFNGGFLRQSLMEFGARRKTAIFIDRRADPTRELNLVLIDLTFEQFLWKVASSCELGACRVGDVYYVGPKKTAAVLPVLLDELKSKSTSRRLRGEGPRWRVKGKLAWPELSEPRQLIEELAQQNELVITNPEIIPYDLWPAVELPELSLEERLALLIVGFDLWFEQTSPREIKLVPLPAVETGSRVVTNVSESAKVARELRQEFASCKFNGRGNSMTITGPVDEMSQAVNWLVDHQQIEQGDPSLSRFSLDTTASRGGILHTIARQLGVKLQFAPELKPLLDERVTITMNEQPIDTIVAEVLKGTGTRFNIDHEHLTISAGN